MKDIIIEFFNFLKNKNIEEKYNDINDFKINKTIDNQLNSNNQNKNFNINLGINNNNLNDNVKYNINNIDLNNNNNIKNNINHLKQNVNEILEDKDNIKVYNIDKILSLQNNKLSLKYNLLNDNLKCQINDLIKLENNICRLNIKSLNNYSAFSGK